MQATSTSIREQRFQSRDERNGSAEKREGSEAFRARRAQVAAIKDAILEHGRFESDFESATLTHCRLRRGVVGGEPAEAQVTRHEAGVVIRFWVSPLDFGDVKVRDLVLLPDAEKGYEVWLDADGKLFPHEGKYAVVGRRILAQKR